MSSKIIFDLTASIVLYNNDPIKVQKVIDCFFDNNDLKQKLFLIDNSEKNTLKHLGDTSKNVEYIFNDANLGFGKAHNMILLKTPVLSKYHIVLNPDVYFEGSVLVNLFNFMEKNESVGHLMPKVLYPDGSIQYICKLLPRPIDLIARLIMPFDAKWKRKFDLRFFGYDKEINIPFLSGCFMFLRSSIIDEIGGFDDNIFMYYEDADLSRRIHARHTTLYYPHEVIRHEFNKESFRNLKLMLIQMKSAIYYFNKYGWIFDAERVSVNKRVLNELEKFK
jgi:GT2 family glycosyltransferase